MEKLNLEIGKRYRSRNGEVVEINKSQYDDIMFPEFVFGSTCCRWYKENGRYCVSGNKSEYDLIEEAGSFSQHSFEGEMQTPVVVIESPYSGDTPEQQEANAAYAKEALKDSLQRGESPMVSHLLYTQALDDNDETERNMGMEAGWQFYRHASKCVVYADRGLSFGMLEGIQIALEHNVPVEVRKIHD